MSEQVNEKVFELLQATGLNWTVSKKPLISKEEGLETESHGLFRNDTLKWMGTVGPIYVPFQNWEMAEVMVTATQNIGLELSRGGQLNDGRRVYLQASLPDQLIGRSNVQRWVTALNSHDGSTAVGFGSTNTVVVCRNTFHRAYGELQKFRHTTTVKERIAIAQKGLLKTLELDNALIGTFTQMADVKIKDEYTARILKALFKLPEEQKITDVSTRKMNQIEAFIASVRTSISEQGDSLWALFNGVTRYTNHVAAPADELAKREYLMSGGGEQFTNVGLNTLIGFLNESTETKKAFAIQ